MERVKTINKNNHNFLRLFFIFFVIILVFLGIFFVNKIGIVEKFNSVDKIRKYVEDAGFFSFIIFMLFQILQTTILQIPSIIVTFAGVLIFGPIKAFVLSFVSIMLGSILMFWFGRKFGRRFLNFLFGETISNRWIEKLEHGKYLFFLMMLFPLFPDDILCAVAGYAKMSFKFFFWTNVIARSLGIAATCFFAGGNLIPFSGWGIAVWFMIAGAVLLMFYLSVKFQNKIDLICNQVFKIK